MPYTSTCLLTSGYSLPCKGTAGIQEVYIGNWNSTSMAMTISGTTTSQITGFTGTTQSFYKFQQQIEQAGFTETGNFSAENGTSFYEQTLEITVNNVDPTLVTTINTLGRGKWRVLILDQNGNYWLMGKQNPVNVTAIAGGLGKAYGDLNGFTITFTGKEYDSLYNVTTAAALQIIS